MSVIPRRITALFLCLAAALLVQPAAADFDVPDVGAAGPVCCDYTPPSNDSSTTYVPDQPGGGPPPIERPSPEELRAQREEELTGQGHDAFRHGNYHAAIQYFEQALDYNWGNWSLRNNIAAAQNELGHVASSRADYAEAVRWYELAVQNHPRDETIRANLEAARGQLRWIQEAPQDERRLDDARRRIGTIIANATGGGTAGGSEIADPAAGGTGPTDTLDFVTPGGTVGSDASVVDLTHLDPDKPMVVDPRTVGGESAAPIKTARLVDAVKSRAPQGKANPRTTVLLDALEAGGTDWAESYRYLEEGERRFPDNPAFRDAKYYLRGLTIHVEAADRRTIRELLEEDLHRDMEEALADLDEETWSLVRRAEGKMKSAGGAADYEAVLRLYRQANEKRPDVLFIRDAMNFVDGRWAAEQADIRD